MVDGENDFSASQVGYLFTFLARQISRGDNSLSVSRDLFDKVLQVLTENQDGHFKEERQQALLGMATK